MGHFQPTSASAVCSGFWFFSAWPSFPWASLNLKQRQLPIQRLTHIFCMEATMDLDIMGATTATLTTDTMETVLVTMVLGTMATMAIPTCMARGLLMLSLFLLLMLMPKLTRIFFMATMGLDMDITGATVMVTATRTTAATTMASKKGRDPIES